MNMSTGVASFAARKVPIRNPQLPTIPSALVSQHRTKLSEAGATDMLGELMILDHAAHVQVLNRQNIEATHQVGSQFVQRILPTVGDLSVQPCDLQPLLIPTTTTLDAPGENPLQSCQPCSVAGSVARVYNPSAITQSCQPTYSKVNPDLASSLGEHGLGWFIQTKTHEVASIPALDYRAGSRLARETATPFDVKPTDFGNCKIAINRIPFETSRMIFGGLLPMFGSELRIGRALGEEIGKGRLQMPQSLLLRNTRRFTQPRKRTISTMLRPSRTTCVVVDRLPVLKAVRPQPQGKVVGVPDTTKLTRQLSRLAGCRVASECHANFHLQEYATYCKNRQELSSEIGKVPLKGEVFNPTGMDKNALFLPLRILQIDTYIHLGSKRNECSKPQCHLSQCKFS